RGTLDSRFFPTAYWETVLWTREQLTLGQMAFLRSLPTNSVIEGGIQIMHGMRKRSYRYVTGSAKLRYLAAGMKVSGLRYTLYGHTHHEACHRLTGWPIPMHIEKMEPDNSPDLTAHGWYLINPGTVGQPRT